MKIVVEIEFDPETQIISSVKTDGKEAEYNHAMFDPWYTLFLQKQEDGCAWEIQLTEQVY